MPPHHRPIRAETRTFGPDRTVMGGALAGCGGISGFSAPGAATTKPIRFATNFDEEGPLRRRAVRGLDTIRADF